MFSNRFQISPLYYIPLLSQNERLGDLWVSELL